MNSAMRMTEGSITGQMLRFMLPLFIGNLFQQLYNAADALIVGRMLGEQALAAVAGTGNLVFLIVSFFSGIASGAGVAISRYYGSKEPDKLQSAIHTSVAFGIFATAVLTLAGVIFSPALLRWMDTPEDVMAASVEYMSIYFAGSLSLVMYNTFRGIMQAVGDSRNPLIYLIISSIINVILDILFIKYIYAGVGSAAVATVIAQLLSAVLCMSNLLRADEEYRLRLRKISVDWKMLKLILYYGVPSGLQYSVVAFANVVVQANINAFGTMAVAGCGAYNKIEGFVFIPVDSLGLTTSTFVSQNLGAGLKERAKKGAALGLFWMVLLCEVIGILAYILAPELIGIFVSDADAMAFGVGRTRSCALFYFLMAITNGLSCILRGAGRAVAPMAAILGSWCVLRVAILEIAVPIFQSIQVVYWVYPITWAITAVYLLPYFIKGSWINGFEIKREG